MKILFLLTLFATPFAQAATAFNFNQAWTNCTADTDCKKTESVCGRLQGVNAKYVKELAEHNAKMATIISCSRLKPEDYAEDTAARVTCQEGKCLLAPPLRTAPPKGSDHFTCKQTSDCVKTPGTCFRYVAVNKDYLEDYKKEVVKLRAIKKCKKPTEYEVAVDTQATVACEKDRCEIKTGQ